MGAVDAGIRFNGQGVEYIWFRDGGRLRLLRLFRLSYIPVSYREDPDVMGKAWAMLRGLYAARVDFAYLAAGIWSPRPVGVLRLNRTSVGLKPRILDLVISIAIFLNRTSVGLKHLPSIRWGWG